VAIWHHHTKARNELPHMFVLSVKNVRSVGVHHDARFMPLGMTIASYVITGVKNRYGMTRFGQLPSYYGA